MVKKNDVIITDKKVDKDKSLSALKLKAGKWKSLFTEQQFKMLVAEALNSILDKDEFKGILIGYLITYSRVYLVLKIKHSQMQKMLRQFYENIKKSINNYYERINAEGVGNKWNIEILNNHDLLTNLFNEFPLKNEHLIKLITGRKVELPYYSPHVEWLKEKIKNYNFCSAIDYSGAKGPVLVTLLKMKEYE